jgi:hypothetical protein
MEEIKEEILKTKIIIEPPFKDGITLDDYKRAIGFQTQTNNNYSSSYAVPSLEKMEAKGGFTGTLVPIVPISTPKAERKGHNGPHQSHISKK